MDTIALVRPSLRCSAANFSSPIQFWQLNFVYQLIEYRCNTSVLQTRTGKYILLKEDQRMTVNASMEKMFSFFSQLASVFDYLSYQKNTVVLWAKWDVCTEPSCSSQAEWILNSSSAHTKKTVFPTYKLHFAIQPWQNRWTLNPKLTSQSRGISFRSIKLSGACGLSHRSFLLSIPNERLMRSQKHITFSGQEGFCSKDLTSHVY